MRLIKLCRGDEDYYFLSDYINDHFPLRKCILCYISRLTISLCFGVFFFFKKYIIEVPGVDTDLNVKITIQKEKMQRALDSSLVIANHNLGAITLRAC